MAYQNTKHKNTLPLIWKMILSYTLLVCILLMSVLGYLMYQRITEQNETIENKITELSATLSQNPTIINEMNEERLSPELQSYLDSLQIISSYVDYIVVVNTDDIRLYHTEHERIGKSFEGGDEGPALSGTSGYLTKGKGSRLYQLRSFSSIYDQDGNVLGFVLVSTYMSRLSDMRFDVISQFGIIFVLAILLGFLFASLIAQSIRHSLLGYEPNQLRELYLEKMDVLNSLEEGIIATDAEGNCIFYNNSALGFFQKEDTLIEFLKTELQNAIIEKDFESNKRIRFGVNDFLVNLVPLQEQAASFDILVILRDRTEVNELAEELTGVQHIIGALRATTHEHKNKMHVIMGLLQIGDMEGAKNYISTLNSTDYDSLTKIYDRIENKTIAALLCGKQNRANELNITLTLQTDSHLDAHNDYLSANDCVTIVGNLIENAFDALKNWDGLREITVFIQNTADGITIIVDDTGPGMSEECIQKIYREKYTTKGEGHGIGLSLIKNIIAQSNGTLDIESTVGEGSSFTISIHEKRIRKENKS